MPWYLTPQGTTALAALIVNTNTNTDTNTDSNTNTETYLAQVARATSTSTTLSVSIFGSPLGAVRSFPDRYWDYVLVLEQTAFICWQLLLFKPAFDLHLTCI